MPPLPPPSPLPEFVYKITPTSPPDPIPEQYPLSELDRQDGFVHLSTSWQARLRTIPYLNTQPLLTKTLARPNKQVPITADLFFGDAPSFYLLKLRLAGLGGVVRWDEVDGTNGCPHLYGNFGARDVVAVREFRRGEGRSWREVLEGEEAWLE